MGQHTRQLSKIIAYALLVLIAAVFLVRTVIPSSGRLSVGFMAYYVAGQSIRDADPALLLYDDSWFKAQVVKDSRGAATDIYLANPPTLAVAWAPLAYLSVSAARRLWIGVSALCLVLSLCLIAQELNWFGHPWALVALSTLVTLAVPTREQFGYGQIYAFLLLLHVVGWRAYVHRRDAGSGIALGIAMALKVSGWPIGLLMLAQRRWIAVSWVIATAAAMIALSLPWVGFASWRLFLLDVIPRTLARDYAVLPVFQDTTGFWQHLFRYVPVYNPTPLLDAPRLATALTLATAIGAAVLLMVPRRTASLGFVAAVALSETLSPVAEQYHYMVLYLPLAVLWHQACVSRSRLLGCCALAATLLIALPLNYTAPHPMWSLVARYPRLAGGWIIFAALLVSDRETALPSTALARAQ